MRDPFAGKFAALVGIVLDMGVNVVGDRIQPVGRVGKYGGAHLFEGACQDIDVFEVFDLQAGLFALFAGVGEGFVFF